MDPVCNLIWILPLPILSQRVKNTNASDGTFCTAKASLTLIGSITWRTWSMMWPIWFWHFQYPYSSDVHERSVRLTHSFIKVFNIVKFRVESVHFKIKRTHWFWPISWLHLYLVSNKLTPYYPTNSYLSYAYNYLAQAVLNDMIYSHISTKLKLT